MMEEAVLLLEEMQSSGLEANVITYTACLTACGNAAEWERAVANVITVACNQQIWNDAKFSKLISAHFSWPV